MKDSIAPRGFRAALLVFSGALLFGVAACSNQYGPPMEGQPVSWGQQHYLNNKLAQERHLDGRSDSAGAGAQAGGADH
jgi:hypothetical protein